jgi:hypothetical protein
MAVGTTRVSRVVDDATGCCTRSPRARLVADFVAIEPALPSEGVAVVRATEGRAGDAVAGGVGLSGAAMVAWLIRGTERVCTLPAANNASIVLIAKTALMVPPNPWMVLDTPSSMPVGDGGAASNSMELGPVTGGQPLRTARHGMSLLPRCVKSSTVSGIGPRSD